MDVVVVDRTDTIKTPILTKNLFPVPQLRPMTKSYEDICNERARELLAKTDLLGTRMYVLYSGGIDSTLVVVSLLKNATESQKKNITILLSDRSIVENPNFYRDFIVGKLDVKSSANFPYILGTDSFLVTGEHNDQLFGSDMVAKLIVDCGAAAMHRPYEREFFIRFLNSFVDDPKTNLVYAQIFEKLCSNAPVPIKSNFDMLWWINFSLKWQAVFVRMLMYTTEINIANITQEYIETKYHTFYGTDDFQLWSLNNLDMRIKDTWKTYKWVCKDIIFEYSKDRDYRDNKTKRGSLSRLMSGSSSYNFVDESLRFYKDLSIDTYYCPENDFR